MNILHGKPVCGNIISGKLFIYTKKSKKVKRYNIRNTDYEIERFNEALKNSLLQLNDIYRHAAKEIGEKNAIIFYIHQMMLRDENFTDTVKNKISINKINAEAAVSDACSEISSEFSAMHDDYMRERSADIKDISERVISNLSEKNSSPVHIFKEPVILAAENFTPSDIIKFSKSRAVAFLSENGSSSSHASILLKTMHIPSLTEVKGILNPYFNGKYAIINGKTGKIFIEPEPAVGII